jgi:hypothetical protein
VILCASQVRPERHRLLEKRQVARVVGRGKYVAVVEVHAEGSLRHHLTPS